jgi:membrane protein YqaA with SNARE-associated domain
MCFAGASRLPAQARRGRGLTEAWLSLASLFAASFLASTLIPISSEAALFAVLRLHADLAWPAIAVATLGNTLGGLTTYLIGRYIGSKKPLTQLERVRRYGSPLLALAWLPFVGDALCLAAGWVKLNWVAVALWSAAGRFARYWLVAQGALW